MIEFVKEIENPLSRRSSIHFNTLSLFSFFGWKEKEISILTACLLLRQNITPEAVFNELVDLKANLFLKSFHDRKFLKIRKVLDKLENIGYLVKRNDKWFVTNQDVASSNFFYSSKYIYWQKNDHRAHNHGFAKLTFTKQDVMERETKSIRDMFLLEMISLYHEDYHTSWEKIKEKFNVSRYEINKIETVAKTTVKLRHNHQKSNAVKYSKTTLSFDVGIRISQTGKFSCGYRLPRELAKQLGRPEVVYSRERRQPGYGPLAVKGIYDFLDSKKAESFLLKRSNDTIDYKISRCKKKWSQTHNGKEGRYNFSYVKTREHSMEIKHVRNTLFLRPCYSKRLDRNLMKAVAPVYCSPKIDVFNGY